MKSGAGDDPFADDEQSENESPEPQPQGVQARDETTDGEDENETLDGIPYIFRRDTVKDGRTQVPFFLRPEIANEGERDLMRKLEDAVGEDIPVTDVREAAYVAAQRNPELVVTVLEEWGYGLR